MTPTTRRNPMRRILLTLAAAALLLAPSAATAPAKHHATAAPAAFVSLTITDGKFRVTGTNLTPGSYAGVLLAYRDYAQTTSRTARVNVAFGHILTGDDSYLYEVGPDGHVTIAGGVGLFTGGHVPGRLVAVLATTGGDLADAETDVG